MRPDGQPRPLIPAYPDETLEDLQRGGFRMLQKKPGFRFGTDSVLLAAYGASFYLSHPGKEILIADIGAGCGAVSLLLAARLPAARIVSMELDERSAGILRRNCRLNHLESRMKVIQADIRDLASGVSGGWAFEIGSFDLVISNPPYWINRAEPLVPENESNALDFAREEATMCFRDLASAAKRLLKPRGRMVLIHQAGRLPEIIGTLHEFNLEPKTLRFVQPSPRKAPATFLLSAVSQGRTGGFCADKPLIVYTESGQLSPEIAEIYGHDEPLSGPDLQEGLEWVADETGSPVTE